MNTEEVPAETVQKKNQRLEKNNQRLSLIVSKQKELLTGYENIFHSIPDIAVQYVDRDGTVFKWNKTSERLYGYREDEVAGRRLQDILLPAGAAGEFTVSLDKVWLSGEILPPIGWYVGGADGTGIYLKASAVPIFQKEKPIAICCMQLDTSHVQQMEELLLVRHRDIEQQVVLKNAELRELSAKLHLEIDERQRIQNELLESEHRFKIFADYNYEWEFWIGSDRKMIYVTPSCERITGYRAEEFMENERLLSRLVHPDDFPGISCLKEENFRSLPKNETRFRIITRDGRVRWIAHVCQPVFSPNGIFLGRRASNRDITGQLAAEEGLKAAHNDLERIVEERTAELLKSNRDLDQKQTELLRQQASTDRLNQKLLETNKAISILAKNLERTHSENERKIASIINSKIMPIISQLRKDPRMEKGRPDLDVMAAYFYELTSHLDSSAAVFTALSTMEANVAMLINKGFSTNEIAARVSGDLKSI